MIERHEVTAIVEAIGDVTAEQLSETKRELAESRALIKSLSERIEALEKMPNHPVLQGSQPDEQGIREMIRSAVQEHTMHRDAIISEIGFQVSAAVAELPRAKDGKDADPVDIDAVVERVLAQIPTPKDGKDGERGEVGPQGPAGPQGERGLIGEKGMDGKDGRDGREGKDGRDGIAGRDALDIEILPAIDHGKTYPRGTFALDKGGLWRRDATGWNCILNGNQGFDVTQEEDMRTFTFTVKSSDGTAVAKQFTIPVLEYLSVYKAGTSYQRGQCVTWDGSLWHCNEATGEAPGKSTKWTLAVRKGQNGKDGKPGDKGDPGPEGKAGRDLRYQ